MSIYLKQTLDNLMKMFTRNIFNWGPNITSSDKLVILSYIYKFTINTRILSSFKKRIESFKTYTYQLSKNRNRFTTYLH
ncbi:hypothetical protein Hdeb2414_s0034g00727041 [Helianthus debilis subsp. tardiflorus]